MQAVVGRAGPRSGSDAGRFLVPSGVALTLVGVVGDLVAHTLEPANHAHEQLVVLSASGNNPWHLILFAGIVVSAVGAIRWASRLESEFGNLLAAVMVLLLAAAVGLGAYSGWQARGDALTLAAPAAHSHPIGALDGPAEALGATAAQGAEGASFTGHRHGAPGSVSPQQAQILARQLAVAKASTSRYRRVGAAKADGYFQVTQFIPGLGLHLANLGISNKVFDPAHPQVLLYQPNARGRLVLAGVAYAIAHTGPNDEPPAGFAGNADVWHFHRNLCFLPGGSVSITPGAVPCKARGGYFQARTAWLLHAWIWKDNPNGVFTESNPDVF